MKRLLATVLAITITGALSLTAQVRIYTPELVNPANMAINQAPNVILDWNAVTGGNTGIINYEVQLDTDPAFTNPVLFQTQFITAVQTTELIFGETYFWRVRAIDGTDVSPWSDPWSFRVIRRIVLTKPTDASEQKTDVTLEWTAISGLTHYEIQVDTVSFWSPVISGTTANILGSCVLNDTAAWLVGAGGKVLFFDGSAFTEQASGVTSDLASVSFIDGNNGWAVGKGGTIIYFNGIEWTAQTSGTTNDLTGVVFTDLDHGWAVGKSGIILHYTGGAWSTQYTAPRDLYSVSFIDASNGWAAGKGGLIVHYNGTSWTEEAAGLTPRDLFAVGAVDASNAFAMGKSGIVLQFSNNAWSVYPVSLTTKDILGMVIKDGIQGWAVGITGTLLEFDGLDWFAQSAGTTAKLNTVAINGDRGFIGGDAGAAFKFSPDAFNSPASTNALVEGTINTLPIVDLYFGSTYYWRARGIHSQGESGWSGAKSFLTVSTVELDKPTDNSTNQNLDVILKWKTLTDRVSYEIQVDDDPAFESPINFGTSEGSITADLLTFGINYNWRVRAVHVKDISDWSAPWDFSTVSTVTLTEPANNATDVKLTPILKWEALTGITHYEVEFNNVNDFTDPLYDAEIEPTTPNWAVPVVLEKESQYFWRVRAIAGLDSSNWSTTFNFTTVPPVGIDEPSPFDRLEIYPNPASQTLWIDFATEQDSRLSLVITDLLGKTLVERQLEFTSGTKARALDVTRLPKGIYLMKIGDGQSLTTRKLIIER